MIAELGSSTEYRELLSGRITPESTLQVRGGQGFSVSNKDNSRYGLTEIGNLLQATFRGDAFSAVRADRQAFTNEMNLPPTG